MQQYLDVLARILREGTIKTDVQGPGNIAVCGAQMEFDMADGFPLITCRDIKGSWKAMRAELIWMLSGSTNIKGLHEMGVHLWDAWATPEICERMGFPPGELGPVYGHHWRNFGATKIAPGLYEPDGIDQVQRCVDGIRANPDRRRHVISAWDPTQVEEEDVYIAPCHVMLHFCGDGQGGLDLHLFQRAADVPIGVPFNTAEYALFLMMMAQVTGMRAGKFVHTLSDAHIYRNQIPYIEELLTREPLPLSRVTLNPDVRSIFDFRLDDFELHNYVAHPAIKGIPVAV